MSIEKYNRVQETPKYQVTRKKLSEVKADEFYPLMHIGVYQSDRFGITCYADYMIGDERVRSSLPKRYTEQIDEMCHDDDVMRDIHDGKTLVKFHPFFTRAGFSTFEVIFKDL